MSDVKSKNLYELLGNTSDQDSDREPEPPTKAVDKPVGRSGKRDAPATAPVEAAPPANADRGGRGDRRRGGFGGSDAAFRDRATGRNFNRERPTGEAEDGVQTGRDPGPGARRDGRGGRVDRGPRGPRRGGDRHSRTGQTEHVKQADQSWGANTGEAEMADEKAGDTIAADEVKEDGFGTNVPAPTDEAQDSSAPTGNGLGESGAAEAEEPEDTNKSYAEYLAEQAAKKLEGLGLKEARQPNEGSKDNKKWKSAKELTKEEDGEYFAGAEKSKRERERAKPAKERLDIDYTFKEPAREDRGAPRGGRGRGRGDRGDRGDRPERGGRGGGERGDRENRGDRGDRPDRGEYRGRGGRGEFGGRGRGERTERGEYRGRGRGRGGSEGPAVAVNDESAFPSLGGSK